MFKVLCIDNFPEVTIRYFPATMSDTDIWLEEMTQVFDRKEPFVLFYPIYNDQRLVDVDAKTTQAMRKKVVLWVKKNKDKYAQYCQSIVLPVHPERDDRALIEKQCKAVEAFYKVPAKILERGEDKKLKMETFSQ